jgi:alpha-beta hydrolase superfamily lysophospholipase
MEGNGFFSFDDYKLHAYELNEAKHPKAIVQIIHGMGEHSLKYEQIANFLISQGFIVFINDHRAHGKTAQDESKIGIYEGDIFYDTVKDQIYISEYLISKYNLPLIVLGHSFGSFVAQRYHQLYSGHSALILIGSSFFKNNPSIYLGAALASILTKVQKKDSPAKIIHNMSFKNYNKKFADKNWLTSDKKEQQKQRNDKNLNKIFSNNFYKYFFNGLLHLYKHKNLTRIKKQIPIFIMSGKEDALNKNDGEHIKKLQEFYKKIGVNKVELKIYDKKRHEILNEVNRQEVYEDILSFILRNVKLEEKIKKGKIK